MNHPIAPLPRMVIAGGSGFIGRALTEYWSNQGYDILILGRTSKTNTRSRQIPSEGGSVRTVTWDAQSVGEWWRELEGATALVNLAGRTVDCRPSPENLAEVLCSRVDSTRVLGEALSRCVQPPKAWVQASTLAGYADLGDEWVEESAPKGQGFLADVCHRWEAVHLAGCPAPTRSVLLRIGMVLGTQGGALAALARLTRWGLGGAAGSGRQWMSWIHLADMVSLIDHAATRPNYSGPFNACAPAPVTNAEFMRVLRGVLGRPWCPNAPTFAVKLGAWMMGTNPELALTGWRGRPKRALEAGFRFAHPELRPALRQLLAATP